MKIATAQGSETAVDHLGGVRPPGAALEGDRALRHRRRQRHDHLRLRRRQPPQAGVDHLGLDPEPHLHLRQPRLPAPPSSSPRRASRATAPSPTPTTTPAATPCASRTVPTTSPYAYDRAERLTDATETATGRLAKKLYYDLIGGATQGYSRGKLVRARADNYYNGTNNFQAVETYTYSGVGGRVSARTTCAGGTWNDPFTCPGGTSFNQSFTWTDLGAPATVVYPDNTATTVDPGRTVCYSYTNGFLTAVPSFATSISYHPNTMVNAVLHANGVTDTHGADANAMQRPASIATTGASSNWSSGAYGYDGAGNVKAIGADYYIYDKVSRLTEGAPRGATKKQRYQYDAFGNITKIETMNGPIWDPRNTPVAPPRPTA